ncbi:MAG TPA: aminoglycoside adenylyltransferase domain-containing protein [Acidimicrobiia bacterium]
MSGNDRVVREFASELADALAGVAADGLVGVYLHGSAVLGDWNAPASDVDVLVVVEDEVASSTAERLVAVLSSDRARRFECPGTGLEASVVAAGAASKPVAPWPYVVHVTTNPRKVAWGMPGRGDADLILHYAVAREYGCAAYGPAPRTVFGAIPEPVVVRRLVEELRWAVDHSGAAYAILNACRALRYRHERTFCSKTDGGTWAIARGIQPALVQRALDARRLGVSRPLAEADAAWVLGVAADLA